MSKKNILRDLDRVLRPLGFRRLKGLWNRNFENLVDVIEVQFHSSNELFTLNCGILDIEISNILWGDKSSEIDDIPQCTVSVRLGDLVDGKDLWLRVDDEEASQLASEYVRKNILPFLENMHGRQAMKSWLVSANAKKSSYPPIALNFALLEFFLGDKIASEAILDTLSGRTTEPWRQRIAEIKDKVDL